MASLAGAAGTRRRSGIPFAWLSLTHKKTRLLASISGVAFATVLMFVELGFRNGLTDSQVYVARMFNADLVIVFCQDDNLLVSVHIFFAELGYLLLVYIHLLGILRQTAGTVCINRAVYAESQDEHCLLLFQLYQAL